MKTPIVLKLGGAALAEPAHLAQLCARLGDLQRPLVLVHGGGQLTAEMLATAGFTSSKKDGQRMTPAAHMPVVCGALAGVANTQLVQAVQQAGLRPVGLSLVEGPLVALRQQPELGAVGSPDFGQSVPAGVALLKLLLEADYLPVISSIGIGPAGQLLNVNADYAAAAVAAQLQAELVLLSDVPGVLAANGALIPQLSCEELTAVLEQDWVQGGMQVKLAAAAELLKHSGGEVVLASWKEPAALLAVLRRSPTAAATRITP